MFFFLSCEDVRVRGKKPRKKTIKKSLPDDAHWKMGWKISDLFLLVICQVRNHDANNDFSLWSEEFISVRPKVLLGSEAPNLKGHTVIS